MFPNWHHGSTRVLLSMHTANCTRSRAKGPALLLVFRSHRETKRAVVLSGPYKLKALSVMGGLSPAFCYFFPPLRRGGALVEKLLSWVHYIISVLALISLLACHSGHLYSESLSYLEFIPEAWYRRGLRGF